MRLCLSFCFLLIGSLLSVQQGLSQEPRSKDETAVSVLRQMVAITGWKQVNLPSDLQATGSITTHRGGQDSTTSISIKVRGDRQVRISYGDDVAINWVVYNHGNAARIVGGKTRRIPSYVSAARRPAEFPFLTELTDIENSTLTISYAGEEQIGRESSHKIEFIREPQELPSMHKYIRRVRKITVWVSATTGLPLQMEYNHVTYSNPYATIPVLRTYSDFRPIGGLLIPFRQQVFIGGDLRRTLLLNDVMFNTGLGESDFDVPVATQ